MDTRRAKMGQGSRDYSSFGKSVEADLKYAAAQARHISAEAKDAEIPSVRLTRDLWPPLLVSGARVYVERIPLETIKTGTFMLIRHKGHLMACRFLEWSFVEGAVHMTVKVWAAEKARQTLPAKGLLGVMVKVVKDDLARNPNREAPLERLAGILTDYGTLAPHAKLVKMIRDALGLMQHRKARKASRMGLSYMIRQINDSEKERLAKKALAAELKARQKDEMNRFEM